MHAAPSDDEDAIETVLSAAAARSVVLPKEHTINEQMFNERLGMAGQELLNVGLSNLQKDVDALLPYFTKATTGVSST